MEKLGQPFTPREHSKRKLICLPQDLYEKAQRMAQEQGVSFSHLNRMALIHVLKDHKVKVGIF